MDREPQILAENGVWRRFNYMSANTHSTAANMAVIRNAGEAFGGFRMMRADFDAAQLHGAISDFAIRAGAVTG